MSISKEQIETRKSDLEKDFQTVKQQIEDSEVKIVSMNNNLNALADTASITATAATNAGRTNVFPDTSQNTTVTLPTPSAGLSFRFIYGGAAADATDHIIKTAGNTIFFKGAITHLDTDGNSNAVVFSDGNSNSVISLVTPQSYVIDLVGASATVYHVSGFISDVTVPTIADA